jgi:hypothetical protein
MKAALRAVDADFDGSVASIYSRIGWIGVATIGFNP